MSTLADYQGRRFDLLALRGAVPVGEALLRQSLFGADSSGEICTGVQKLAQRWVLEFLTIRKSLRFLPKRGCDFMQEFYAGLLHTEVDVQQAFLSAALTIRTNLQTEETADMADDERLDHAELQAIALSPNTVSLTINIVSLAGDARAVILPVSIVPIRPML